LREILFSNDVQLNRCSTAFQSDISNHPIC